jgi:hypothetical protein
MTWDFETYRSQQHDMASLKGMMELIGNWSKELEKLRNKPIGILEVDSKKLKGELNPMREKRLEEIKEYIKDVARYLLSLSLSLRFGGLKLTASFSFFLSFFLPSFLLCILFLRFTLSFLDVSPCFFLSIFHLSCLRVSCSLLLLCCFSLLSSLFYNFCDRIRCAQLLDHYKESLVKLSTKPLYLKEFANQVQTIISMREDEKSLYKATSQVDQMYNLLQQYEVKIPSEDLVLHEDLHERQQEYRHEIEFAQSYRDMKMPEMITAVDSNLIKLQDNINVMVSKLEDPMFNEMDNYFDSEKVLEELVAVGSRLENADQLAKTYGSYQKLFNVTMTSQKELEVGKEKWETLKLLWECIAKWNERYKYWLETQFTDLNAEGKI